jgi:hypothetical protein
VLPPSHVAYTWLALSLAQDTFHVAPDADYRLVAAAAIGSDLVDKPLAWAYFYRKHKSAVLFAHTLLAYVAVVILTARCLFQHAAPWTDRPTLTKTPNAGEQIPQLWVYAAAFVGHALLDRLWFFPDTFYWPLRGLRFHVWRKRGSEQEEIGKAYWIAFTRRPELWGWEVGGLLALAWFVWRYRLYRPRRLLAFARTGRPHG